MIVRIIAAFVLAFGAIGASAAAAAKEAAEKAAYKPMAPFVKFHDTAWRGEGTGPDGKPIVDIARYEMILGGRAFQSTHRLEGETYGGRTIIFYDESAETYIFHYFTTAGFHTVGDLTLTETGFSATETVEGHAEIAAVRSQSIFGDDAIEVRSTYIGHDGEESSGDGRIYRRIDDPGPLFFDEADALFGKRTDVKDAADKYKDND